MQPPMQTGGMRELHAKEEVGRGGCSAPGMVQCRGTRRRGTVVGVCLVPEEGAGMRV